MVWLISWLIPSCVISTPATRHKKSHHAVICHLINKTIARAEQLGHGKHSFRPGGTTTATNWRNMRFTIGALAAALSSAIIHTSCDAFVVPGVQTSITRSSPTTKTLRTIDSKQKWHLLSTVNEDAIEAAVGEAEHTGLATTLGLVLDEVENESEEKAAEEPFKLVLEEVPPASYEVKSTPDAPGGGNVHTLTIHLGAPGHPDPIVIQTGKIGRQASAAVTLTRGDSVLYATASRDKDTRDIDFLPLSVEHQERFSSAGLTSGAFNKRDGRPGEHEILVCRLIDRPLRPLIAEGWRHETQLLSWILSYDGVRTCDPLAVTASAAALWLSDVPLIKPVAAAMVGYIDSQFVLNPTQEQMKHSRLNLTVAGTKDAVLMIEGAADFLPEDLMIEAVTFGHEAIKIQCAGLEELSKVAGKEKKYDSIKPPVEGLKDEMFEMFAPKVDEIFDSDISKEELSAAMSELTQSVKTYFEEKYPDNGSEVIAALKDLECSRMFAKAKAKGLRIDGRKLNEVRGIDSEVGLFPRVHGSALFTRGQTQVVATGMNSVQVDPIFMRLI
jgi:ribonuclease PH